MSVVNTREKTITAKIVYYGPGLGGKTTSLKAVHDVLDPEKRVKLISLKTDEERTLFFDFLPLDLGMIGGYKLKIQGFTVPGQVKYNLTRKYVLMGADGVVFVADSQFHRMDENVESLANLKENLHANRLDIEQIPLVFQYNKRDLENLASVADLETALNPLSAPSYPGSAATGENVFEAFVETACTMLDKVAQKYRIKPEGDCSVGDATRKYLNELGQRT